MWRLYVWLIIPIVMVFCLGGCKMEEDHSSPTQTMSLLTFDYDAARDVALAHTYPSTYIRPLTAQGYVTALAVLPAVNYHPTANIHLANPIPRVDKKHLVVNYDSASGLDQLSSSQAAGLMAVLEDWLWAYEIKDVDLLVEGRPVRTLGPLTITQPLHRQFHTYVIQPVTGEVGYLVGALTPKSLADAVAILNRKEISELPALHGFEPLLPPQVRITAPVGRITDGTLTANLSSSTLPSPFDTRLTGIVLMLTQFPGIDAVQFTFAGVKRDAPFMRGNLNAPISSMQLLLPPLAAKPANRQTAEIIRRAIPVDQEENELTFCSTLIWQDWAMVTTTSRSYLLERQDETYTVRFADNELQAKELLIRKVPSDVIIAFRISGWQDLER